MASYLLRKAVRRVPGRVIKTIPLPEPALTEGFGARGQAGEICRAAGCTGCLLVTDRTLFSLGYHQAVVRSLEESGIRCTVFSDIASEPNVETITAGREAARRCGADLLLALGGGSVLDTTKMIAAGMYHKRRKTRHLLHKFLFIRSVPVLNIPSTAGTGAEITVAAMVTRPGGRVKGATVIGGLNVFHVILDSQLTLYAPRRVTAACAIDALSHGLEGVVSATRVPPEDRQKSMECVRLVLTNLPAVLAEPETEPARLALCRAAYYGGNAINKQLAGYVHAFAHTLGAKYHIPHGEAIALSLLPVMEAQREACLPQLAELAVYCGLAKETETLSHAADSLLQAVAALIRQCDFPQRQQWIQPRDRAALIRTIEADSINYTPPAAWKRTQIERVLDRING